MDTSTFSGIFSGARSWRVRSFPFNTANSSTHLPLLCILWVCSFTAAVQPATAVILHHFLLDTYTVTAVTPSVLVVKNGLFLPAVPLADLSTGGCDMASG